MRFTEINNAEDLPLPDMVCRTCTEPLNRRRLPGGDTHWVHGGIEQRDHDVDPIPKAESLTVKLICDFCCVAAPVWSYHTTRSLNMSLQIPDYSTEVEVQQISRGSKQGFRRIVGKHKELDAIDGAQTIDAAPWTACEDCANLIELRDLNRLVTRVRRVNPTLGTVSSKILKANYAPFMRSIGYREQITDSSDQPAET